jgi:hypothetical protein
MKRYGVYECSQNKEDYLSVDFNNKHGLRVEAVNCESGPLSEVILDRDELMQLYRDLGEYLVKII